MSDKPASDTSYLLKLTAAIVPPTAGLLTLLSWGLASRYPLYWQQLLTYGPYAGLVLLILIPLIGNGIWEYFWWYNATTQLLNPLEEAEQLMKDDIEAKMPDLLHVWQLLAQHRIHFQRLLVITTSYQYCLMRTMQVASLGGAFVLAFLVGGGIAHAGRSEKVLFFTFSTLALYCGSSTRLLKHDQNIAAYLGHYQNYQLLQLACYQYALTQTQGAPPGTAGPSPALSLTDFLRGLLAKMSQLPTTTFGLDASQIASPTDLAKRLSSGS